MIKLEPIKKMNEEEKLKYMMILLRGQFSSEKDDLANLSNSTGIINACIDKLNWVGFYIKRKDELVLGPFQGLPACTRIKMGKGVCGTAAVEREVQLVPDVELFPGHIACDSASKSEIVLPIIKNEEMIGVLDLDSPYKDRFSELEKKYLTQAVDLLNEYINWKNI